jgi:hypothetical protein
MLIKLFNIDPYIKLSKFNHVGTCSTMFHHIGMSFVQHYLSKIDYW